MGKAVVLLAVAATGVGAAMALGGTATFPPIGPTTVAPGRDVLFLVSVSADAPGGFDAADIIIGSNDATDIGFDYSIAWTTALANVTPPTPDVGSYTQDVFVGGNHPASVGTSLEVGTVTVVTTGMGEGTFEVRIDPALDTGVSSLTLDGKNEELQGVAFFTIQCAVFDPECDIDVDLGDYALFLQCMTGPGEPASGTCIRFDGNGDGHVDLADMSLFVTQFTGSF